MNVEASAAVAVSPNTALTPGNEHCTAATRPGSRIAGVTGLHVGPDAAANHAAGPVSGAPVVGGATVVRGAEVGAVVGAAVEGLATEEDDGDPPPRPSSAARAAISASAPSTPAKSGHSGLRRRSSPGGTPGGATSGAGAGLAASG